MCASPREAAQELLPLLRESADGRDLRIVGGGGVAARSAEAGARDELRITVMPVVLGSGGPLLPFRRTTPLEPVATTTFEGGAVELVHRF